MNINKTTLLLLSLSLAFLGIARVSAGSMSECKKSALELMKSIRDDRRIDATAKRLTLSIIRSGITRINDASSDTEATSRLAALEEKVADMILTEPMAGRTAEHMGRFSEPSHFGKVGAITSSGGKLSERGEEESPIPFRGPVERKGEDERSLPPADLENVPFIQQSYRQPKGLDEEAVPETQAFRERENRERAIFAREKSKQMLAAGSFLRNVEEYVASRQTLAAPFVKGECIAKVQGAADAIRDSRNLYQLEFASERFLNVKHEVERKMGMIPE